MHPGELNPEPTTDMELESAVRLEPVPTPEVYIALDHELNGVSGQMRELATSSVPEGMLLVF